MKHSELMNKVMESRYADWIRDRFFGVMVLRDDLDIRIVQRKDDRGDPLTSKFYDPWATRYPDKSAHLCYYDLYYGASPVERYQMVVVDGCRGVLPLPDRIDSLRVNREQYQVAKLLPGNEWLDEYMRRSGLTVV